jgi:hypothetical protein
MRLGIKSLIETLEVIYGLHCCSSERSEGWIRNTGVPVIGIPTDGESGVQVAASLPANIDDKMSI